MNDEILSFDTENGLTFTWLGPDAVSIRRSPMRVLIAGFGSFHVWGDGPPEANAPAWADRDVEIELFGPGDAVEINRSHGYGRLTGVARVVSARAQAEVRVCLDEGAQSIDVELTIGCPRKAVRALPVVSATVSIGAIGVGAGGEYHAAHQYGGGVFGRGPVASIHGKGIPYGFGCLGLEFPLLYLYNPEKDGGIEFEFFTSERSTAWLKPDGKPDSITWALEWGPDRLLAPGEKHAFGGDIRLRHFTGAPVASIWKWRDDAQERHGLRAASIPYWARNANIIELRLRTDDATVRGVPDFSRADDPKCLERLKKWQAMGFNVLYLIAPNHTGKHCLSPLDYDPSEQIGGAAAEKQLLDWAHELGYHVVLWMTTVGIDASSPEVPANHDWFTRLKDGSFGTPFGDYAADGDPESSGWRAWLENQVVRVIGRGYDGLFVDGLVARASNNARWSWPGQARNAVQDLVAELAKKVYALRDGLLVFVEDGTVVMQAASGFTVGRYTPIPPAPNLQWSGIGVPPSPDPPTERIAPELIRHYLRVRYATLVPGVVTCDMIEGYYSEASRPWIAQSLLAGCAVKTFSTSVDEPETFEKLSDPACINGQFPFPSDQERSPEHRLKGHEEYCGLLRFVRDEPLVRATPVSLDAVVISGDDAVVGMLHASENRCILALVQFADREANVAVSLAAQVDVTRFAAPAPVQDWNWAARELLRSMVDAHVVDAISIGPGRGLNTTIAPYGFRVFELSREE